MMTACLKVMALAPTAEAIELATSLAPIFQAMYAPAPRSTPGPHYSRPYPGHVPFSISHW